MMEFEDYEKIKNIKRRLENTPKSVLNEKYEEDIRYLLDLVSRQNETIKEWCGPMGSNMYPRVHITIGGKK